MPEPAVVSALGHPQGHHLTMRDHATSRSVYLSVVPESDVAFRTLANAWLVRVGDDAERLQRELRRRYPLAVVQPRREDGASMRSWHVHRDGTPAAGRRAGAARP